VGLRPTLRCAQPRSHSLDIQVHHRAMDPCIYSVKRDGDSWILTVNGVPLVSYASESAANGGGAPLCYVDGRPGRARNRPDLRIWRGQAQFRSGFRSAVQRGFHLSSTRPALGFFSPFELIPVVQQQQITRYEVMQATKSDATPDRWALRALRPSGNESEITFFASRTGAEAGAKQMAQLDVAAGRPAIVVIYNEDGTTDAQFVY